MFTHIKEIPVFACKIVSRCCKHYHTGNISDGGVPSLTNLFIKLNHGKK